MGNSFTNLAAAGIEGWAQELPVHTVPVSTFFMGKYELTSEEMARTLQWAYTNALVALGPTVTTNVFDGVTNVVTNLYGAVWNTEGTPRELLDLDGAYGQIAFTNGAFAVATGKTNFPCMYVTWYGALALCNYLSDRAGLVRAVDFESTNWSVNITATGYRLPTEAEWEKASRGGISGAHFPWPNDSVQGTNNYLYSIDAGKANNLDARYGSFSNHPGHPWFSDTIRTTPVGYYDGHQIITNLTTNFVLLPGTAGADFGQTNNMANGYGLYDMAGNVYEWCLDYHGTNWYTNSAASLADPIGPAAEYSFHTQRVVRGGGWAVYSVLQAPDPSFLRCSFRSSSFAAEAATTFLGFRVARRPTAYEDWALGQGLDPLATNGVESADYDSDGHANYDEYLGGTQPTNALSYFKIAQVASASNQMWLTYWGVSGRVYAVENSTNLILTNGWQTGSTITNDSTGDSQIPVPMTSGPQGVRLKVGLAP